ncbi:MAG: hypothetical protein RR902_01565 [Oscillospiraceae bacterium]
MDFDSIKNKISGFAKDAVDMGKDVAQTAKLNFEISSAEEKVKIAQTKIGKYVSEKKLLQEDPTVSALHDEIFELRTQILDLQEKIKEQKAE